MLILDIGPLLSTIFVAVSFLNLISRADKLAALMTLY